ncbi:sensor histidine kinase [Cohnella silvisoli]|uniref:histidine kinase n=1 Tax=Cohnella silvisoli TaxID=2873699 RepID=A0ABV1KS64_9BACL|nr:sensor histidine kinase [Cohnella silvisoli]MCD9022648.1 sensor histidine kinase [Cohnella silvisoli]
MNEALEFFRNWKLRKKLIASYLILIIIPIVALGMYSYNTAENYLQEQARLGLNNTVEQMALHIDEKMSQPRNFMDFMVFNPTVKKVTGYEWGDDILRYTKELNDNIEPTIWYYIYINQEISDIAFYSEFTAKQIGNFVYPSASVKNSNWYRAAKASNKTLWRYENGTLFAVRKILNYDNTMFTGVVYLKLNYEKLFEKRKAGRTPQERILIADKSGHTIYTELGTDQFREEDLLRIRDTDQDQISIRGQSYILSRADLRNTEWTLYDFTPVKGFIVNTSSIIKATFSIVLACLLILVLFIWLFSRTLVRPIYTLKRKINIVENGDFDIPIVSSSKDEIGELTESFARMVYRVKRLIQELDQARVMEKEAELKALQAQINPHFLYNSLSTINWKAIQIDSPEISKIANSLSRFYRTSLNKGMRITSVQEEIANVKAYLDIQLIMHNHEFEVDFDVEEEAKPYGTLNFILQPIVENAVIHGIDEKESGRGVLTISVTIDSDTIRFVVMDNGKGMTQDEIEQLYKVVGGGYGLRNVHERIRLYYGEAYGVKVESELGDYTKVIIEIPVDGYL